MQVAKHQIVKILESFDNDHGLELFISSRLTISDYNELVEELAEHITNSINELEE